MKNLSSILLIAIGLIAGWGLAAFNTKPNPGAPPFPTSDRQRQVQNRNEKSLLSKMLDEYEERTLAIGRATTSLEAVEALRDTFNYGDDDLAHIVSLGPEDALYELLGDPGVNNEFCTKLAAEWAKKEPAKAVQFFNSQKSFRAADCLAATLPFAFGSLPQLVFETIRSQSLNWQRRHLQDLVTADYWVRNPDATPPPPRPPEADPFDPEYEDNTWFSKPLGSEILNAFEDPGLRAKAEEILSPPQEPKDPENPTMPATVTLDLATYQPSNSDHTLKEIFHKEWQKDPEKMMAEVIERGSIEARRTAMGIVAGEFPMEEQEWPEALSRLEAAIEKFEVIPQNPPYNYHIGPYLQGDIAAQWIACQPLALQRAWTKTFVETWAESEPDQALRWTLEQPESQHRNIALQSGLIIWAHQDPQSAIPFVEALPPGDVRNSAISNAAASWSRIDPKEAKNWLYTLPESPARQAALDRISDHTK